MTLANQVSADFYALTAEKVLEDAQAAEKVLADNQGAEDPQVLATIAIGFATLAAVQQQAAVVEALEVLTDRVEDLLADQPAPRPRWWRRLLTVVGTRTRRQDLTRAERRHAFDASVAEALTVAAPTGTASPLSPQPQTDGDQLARVVAMPVRAEGVAR